MLQITIYISFDLTRVLKFLVISPLYERDSVFLIRPPSCKPPISCSWFLARV